MQAEEIAFLVLESVVGLSKYKLRQKVEDIPEQQMFKGCRFCEGKSRPS